MNQYKREFGWTTFARFSYFSLLIKSDPWSLFNTYWLIDWLRLKISCRQIKVTSSSVISDPLLRRSACQNSSYLWYHIFIGCFYFLAKNDNFFTIKMTVECFVYFCFKKTLYDVIVHGKFYSRQKCFYRFLNQFLPFTLVSVLNRFFFCTLKISG